MDNSSLDIWVVSHITNHNTIPLSIHNLIRIKPQKTIIIPLYICILVLNEFN